MDTQPLLMVSWYRYLPATTSLLLLFNVSHSNCAVLFLEHVVLRVKLEMGGAYRRYSYSEYLSHSDKTALIQHNDVRRGDVTIDLVSPFGTTSHLLPHRPRDFVNNEGFNYWPFMSVRHWGEFSRGQWVVNISYSPQTHKRGYVLLQSLELNLFGAVEVPESVLAIPKSCDEQCIGACGGEGPFLCDVCRSARSAATLQCVSSCSEGDWEQGSYCFPPANSSHAPPAIDETEPWQSSSPGQWNTGASSHSATVTSSTCTVVLCTLLAVSRIFLSVFVIL